MYSDRLVNNDVFVALATRPDLQSLEFQTQITAALVSLARSRLNPNFGQRKLFPQLRKLVCVGDVHGLSDLLPHLTQLTHLEATVVDSHVSSVETLGSRSFPLLDIATYCPNLQVLNLDNCKNDIDISPDELVELAQSSRHLLEHIEISGNWAQVRAPRFETVHIAKIAEALPSLKVLVLAFCHRDWCAVTEAALVEVAKHCGRTLTKCELPGSYNLSNLEESDISFPLLTDLCLEKVVSSTTPDSSELLKAAAANNARFLKRVAPNLEYITVMANDSFGIEVEAQVIDIVEDTFRTTVGGYESTESDDSDKIN
jgi:hypothetical protein